LDEPIDPTSDRPDTGGRVNMAAGLLALMVYRDCLLRTGRKEGGLHVRVVNVVTILDSDSFKGYTVVKGIHSSAKMFANPTCLPPNVHCTCTQH